MNKKPQSSPQGARSASTTKSPRFGLSRLFGLVMLPQVLVLFGVATLIYQTGVSSHKEMLRVGDSRTLDVKQERLEITLKRFFRDVRFLAREVEESGILARASTDPDPYLLEHLGASLLNFTEHREIYDHVRFLNEFGEETIRINFNLGDPEIVPPERLQNKAGRYYFDDALVLQEGEVFVSPFDLNVENGKIEEPRKPVIRFGTPVFDDAGKRRGIVLLNFAGKSLLPELAQPRFSDTSKTFLLNSDGYYLRGPDAASEWSFMYPEGDDITFQTSYADPWIHLRGKRSSQFEDPDKGLFTVREVSWGEGGHRSTSGHWYLVEYQSRDSLLAYAAGFAIQVYGLAIVILSFLLVVSFLWSRASFARRLTNEKLDRNRRELSFVVTTAQDAILTLDSDLTIMFWNQAGRTILGWEEEETPPNLLDLVDRKQAAALKKHLLGREDRSEGTGLPEFEIRSRHLGEVPVELSVSRWNSCGEDYRTVILRDITERRRQEEELRKAKAKAEAASEAKSSFLANMSHEIRTPMNGVIGMAELLHSTELSLEQRRYVRTITTSGESLLELINDILDFSKIEAGMLTIEEIPFNLRSTLDDAVELLSIKAEEQSLDFSGFLDMKVTENAIGDPTRIRQVLLNLAGNALKFTHEGSVSIRGSLAEETARDMLVRFEVTDTGIGIAEEATKTLFQSFTQEDSSTTREFGGTGLGLSISKRLSEMMGGEIGVESVKGEGSTFWFTLRLRKQPAGQVVTAIEPVDCSGSKVLVVNDNETNREIMRRQLQSWGCLVTEAESGVRGLEKIEHARILQAPYDLLLVDMQMPRMDGVEFALRIQGQALEPMPRMVMVTSIGDRGGSAAMEKVGYMALLTKPIKQVDLNECLCQVLALAPSNPTAKEEATNLDADQEIESMVVLVADDNQVNRMVAQSMLKKIGVTILTANNGVEALEAYRERSGEVDLILMDCRMPEMDGFEATAAIREMEAGGTGRTPIVALTAKALDEDREACLEAGMDDYLTKPLKAAALKETLLRWRSGSSSAAT